MRDFCISHGNNKNLTIQRFEQFIERLEIEDGGLHHLHKKYLAILKQANRPL
jgi:Holliday junction resolvasome RuvABC ATP-dependent DNA helicase subunit